MARTLEFYYDYGSPYSYLADTQVEAIAKRAGAALVRKPMLLGGVFKATGNASPMAVELKSKWSAFDLPMWAKHYSVPFKRNPFFPVNTLTLMRGVVGNKIGVKAAGGIRSASVLLAMVDAGANRIGASASVKIVEATAR